MEIITKRLPRDHDIVLAGDLHEGNLMTFIDGFNDAVDRVESNKNTFFCGMGDMIEGITVDDPRYYKATDKGYNPLEQCYEVSRRLERIRNKIIIMLSGNHCWTLIKYGDLMKDVICKELRVPYGTYTCKVVVKDMRGNLLYRIFLTHGFRSISSTSDSRRRRDTNMELQLERRLRDKASDCSVMAMGHTHKLIIAEPKPFLYLTDNEKDIIANYTDFDEKGDYIHPEHRWYINTGSFLKLYKRGVSGYAERFGYDPVDLGYPIIKCRGGKVVDVEKVVLT